MAGEQKCPYCLWVIKHGESVGTCPSCAARYHAECWAENHGCGTFGCPIWSQRDQYVTSGTVPPALEAGGIVPTQTLAPPTGPVVIGAADLGAAVAATSAGPPRAAPPPASAPAPARVAAPAATPPPVAASGAAAPTFCDQCGTRLEGGDRFCGGCGAVIGGA